MTEKIRETLSALMDGEASEIEVHRLLREIERDPGLRSNWIAYQQTRSAIRKEPFISRASHMELAGRLRASIAAEESYNQQPGLRARMMSASYWRPAAGFAVAASLVAAIVVGVQTSQMGEQNPQQFTSAPAAEPQAATASGSAPPLRTPPTTLVSTAQNTPAPVSAAGIARESIPLLEGQGDESELRELDEERMRQVRAYLMRHDRMARMNPYARVVTNPAKSGD